MGYGTYVCSRLQCKGGFTHEAFEIWNLFRNRWAVGIRVSSSVIRFCLKAAAIGTLIQ